MCGRYAGIVLAAGRSSRMEAFKPLLPFGNVTVIERVVATLLSASLSTVSIVLGHRAEDVRAVLAPYPVELIVNPDLNGDMLSSVKCGLRASPGEGNILVALGDQPLIPVSVFHQLMAVSSEHPESIIMPVHQMKRGHPIVLPARLRAEILALAGPGGLKQLLDNHPDAVIEVAVETDTVLLDLDYQQDYQNAIERLDPLSSGSQRSS